MNVATNLLLQEAEEAFLESMRSQYEEKGYTFTVHPNRAALPDFLGDYVPDAIARRPGSNIAIEVKSRPTLAERSLQRIRKLFDDRPDWQLTVAYMGSALADARILPVPSPAAILEQSGAVQRLAANGDFRPAFMMAWSLLEAALNSARPDADKRPRGPGSLVQALAMEGLISLEAEQSLRSLVDLRNRVVHGDLTAEPSEADVRTVLDAVKSILA